MVIIKEWVRNIFMIVVAISFIEIILPSGRMSRYIKFIFSTVMIAVIIEPLANLNFLENMSGKGEKEIAAFYQGSLDAAKWEEPLLAENYIKYSIDMQGIYKSKITEKITEVMSENYEQITVKSVDLSLDERPIQQGGGHVNYIQITVDEVTKAPEIKQQLADVLGISQQKISIIEEKE